MKKITVIIAIAIFISAVSAEPVFIQSDMYNTPERHTLDEQLKLPEEQSAALPENAAKRALGDKDYPVTPGDVYTMSYYDTNTNGTTTRLITQTIQVDSEYRVRVPLLGVIDTRGMTYVQFKSKVETDLNTFYPYMRPQFSFTSCGSFEVYVCGEVTYASYVDTWSLARVSDFCSYATKYASTRTVFVMYPDGSVKVCDLYKAFREDSSDDNPFIKAGCVIRFVKSDRNVTVNGCVKIPGEYQLLVDETLETLITKYAGGFEFNADTSFITVGNFVNGTYETRTLSGDQIKEYVPQDMDSITISELNNAKPYVVVQGAIAVLDGNSTQSGKFHYEFFPGETAEHMLRLIRGLMLTNSDINRIHIIRDGAEIPIDTNLAFTTTERGNVELQQGDIVVIPYLQQYVMLAGGFISTGKVPYEPGKSADYYIMMAGGYSADARKSSLKILDENGNPVEDTSNIMPNTLITVNKRRSNLSSDIALVSSMLALGTTIAGLVTSIVK